MTNKNKLLPDLRRTVAGADGRIKPLFVILDGAYDVRKSSHIVFVCIGIEDVFVAPDTVNILFIPGGDFLACIQYSIHVFCF